MANKTVSNIERFQWDVLWNSASVGFTNKVSPKIKPILDPIRSGSTGKMPLGDRYCGEEGTVDVELQEPTFENMRTSLPWNATNATTLVLAPPINTDMYIYAQSLRLHPNTLAAATIARDWAWAKATPISICEIETDNQKDVIMLVTFKIYVDRSGLSSDPPTFSFGTVGV